MAVAAIIAMRHHEEQLRKIHQGEEAEEVEGNDDIYAHHQQVKEEESQRNLFRAFTECCKSRHKIAPEPISEDFSDEETVETVDLVELQKKYLDPATWPNVPPIFLSYLKLAQFCSKICASSWFNNGVTFTIIIAGINVGIQTYPGMDEDPLLLMLDILILAIFTIELLVKFTLEGFRPWRFFVGPEWAWNNFDTAIVLLSYPVWGLEQGNSIALLRLIRLARLGKLIKKIPALNMIVNGLAGGLSSITYIMVLLFLVFYLYGVVGFYSFAVNDPFHFGTLPLSMITLFRCATLENWGDIMFLNIYGCDTYPDMYVAPEDETSENVILWCRYPSTNWEIAPIYFVSFIVIAALVMLSLFIGAVTISMTESMMELKDMNAKAKALAAKARKARMKQIERDRMKAHLGSEAASLDGSIDSTLGRDSPETTVHENFRNDDNKELIGDDNSEEDSMDLTLPDDFQTKAGLKQSKEEIARALRIAIGAENIDYDESAEKKEKEFQAKLEENNKGFSGCYLRFARWNYNVVESAQFQSFMTIVIVIASFNVGIQTDWRVMRHEAAEKTLDMLDTIILYVFTLEVVMKVFAEAFTPWRYFNDSWNRFDFLIVVGSWVPGAGSSVTMLRLLRLLRVLKLVKRLPQLAVIINALLNGMVSIAYVGLVLILFFYVFSIIGMLLFGANDPWHFGSLHMSFFSLFQAATLDDWTILMYVQQYGCDQYAGVFEDFPEQCTQPTAHGLVAVSFFLVFILIGAQVLLSLFIGVISTSMDEAQEHQAAEQALEKKMRKTAQKLLLDEKRVEAMVLVFNRLDLDGGGSITEEELKIGLDAIDARMSEEDILRILQKVSPDGGGVDANGFILFMYETPMFSRTNAIQKISNAFGANSPSGFVPKPKLGFLKQLYVDIFHYGGTSKRIYWEQMEAALIIQDAWVERKGRIKAKKEARSLLVDHEQYEQLRRETQMALSGKH
eukprot:GSChrysophyteH1.ASY1.ANO1.2263.1 assembled CDS